MKHSIPLFLFVLLSILETNAQKIKGVSFALTTETFSFPFTRLGPIHPGAEIGATLWNKEKPILKQEFNVYLGAYHHTKIENGVYLRADYMPTIKLKNTVGIDFPIGAGYLHSFFPGKLYEQNSDTGEFEKVRQLGRVAVLANLGIGITYLKPHKIQPFVKYDTMIDVPLYNGRTAIKTFIKAGVNFKLN